MDCHDSAFPVSFAVVRHRLRRRIAMGCQSIDFTFGVL